MIKFITHLSGSDLVIFCNMQGVVLFFVEWKHKIPTIIVLARFWKEFHFAFIESDKIKQREIKGVELR